MADFIESRRWLFEIAASSNPGFWGHALYRYAGATRRFLLVNSYRDDAAVGNAPLARAFTRTRPDSLYTDERSDFEIWRPVPLA